MPVVSRFAAIHLLCWPNQRIQQDGEVRRRQKYLLRNLEDLVAAADETELSASVHFPIALLDLLQPFCSQYGNREVLTDEVTLRYMDQSASPKRFPGGVPVPDLPRISLRGLGSRVNKEPGYANRKG